MFLLIINLLKGNKIEGILSNQIFGSSSTEMYIIFLFCGIEQICKQNVLKSTNDDLLIVSKDAMLTTTNSSFLR